ncbi:N-acetylmuramoyl-L-alanine amidase [Coxiella burnetii]|uniref:N-acetylmuramoyl-L-alanine amidase n=2 Tax=Coxiella burnetii TaxID=777 RepID=UPI0003683C7B|nr:N-acetylmuramoyl-L-alanine amidase [Coxiella burnetii]AZV75655.1 N-acetylmuramoyl-L-alanine amidase [Coxiella burnetii]PNT82512.1 N-acetylmuramoyl-L-alanine amidase [Coxiella burnetii]RQM57056.1 N-acetylmuramoyl-L-alanine amidase [Coxiella burnetii]RQM64211.1 N-acetylmuramoyl-L-alanine amidase [Coxiella burnetii]RQM77561.1 N-acetylmuramoyl-L-alanine amidase [Coxiella burnetii]
MFNVNAMRRWRIIIFLLSFWTLSSFSNSNQIIELHVYPHAEDCHLVFDSPSAIHFHYFELTKPERLVVDIQQAHFIHAVKKNLSGPLTKTIRTGYHKNHTLRVVFDLKSPIKIHAVPLKPDSKSPHFRLLIDLISPSHKIKEKTKTIKNIIASPIKSPQPSRARDIIVVIDPGHGGRDPGATGPAGAHEKDIVLKISRYLQRDINRQPGFKAYLTRKGDYYLTLRQRLAIARRYRADMFIAVHADAYKNHRSQGASVFALSQRGATSEAARWLATKENESELMGGVDLADKNNLLKSVLINLSQTATIRDSLHIGQRIIRALKNIGRLHHSRVEQAAFVVLKSPDIPSLLVETGFISNPYEERKLLNPIYQQHIASALMQGICAYFIYSPPRGTWLAQKVKWDQH